MAQSTDKYRDMVKLLHARSIVGKIQWAETSVDDIFTTSLGEYVLTISFEETAAGYDVVIKLYNGAGDLVDSFTDETIKGEKPPGFDGYYAMMTDLHSLARRSATGADQVIENILNLLRGSV